MTKQTKQKNAPVLAVLTKADGTVVEIVAKTTDDAPQLVQPQPPKAVKINRGAVLRGLPTEERSFIADIPVFEDGKLVGFEEQEQKAATVVGRISVKNLDLRKFQKHV